MTLEFVEFSRLSFAESDSFHIRSPKGLQEASR
jgi:hypothetical protein